VEELVLERAQQKLELDGKVIQAGKFDDVTTGAEYEALLVSQKSVWAALTISKKCLRVARLAKRRMKSPTSWTTTS
jgi:hypothetical protein